MFSFAGTGYFTVYLSGMQPDHVRSNVNIADGQWHYLAMTYEPKRVRLFVDGQKVADQPVRTGEGSWLSVEADLAIGSLAERSLGCDGLVDEAVGEGRCGRAAAHFATAGLKALSHAEIEIVCQRDSDDRGKYDGPHFLPAQIASKTTKKNSIR
jgi:hypothetical protein